MSNGVRTPKIAAAVLSRWMSSDPGQCSVEDRTGDMVLVPVNDHRHSRFQLSGLSTHMGDSPSRGFLSLGFSKSNCRDSRGWMLEAGG